MKLSQRLDYARLAEALAERDMAEVPALKAALDEALSQGQLFSEILVRENIVSDWDLSRVVCEVFGLAFFPIEVYKPSKEAFEGIDPNFLNRHALVPLDRYGKVLTIAMPAMVSSDVLTMLARKCDVLVMPLVSTVTSNRNWLAEHLEEITEKALDQVKRALPDTAAEEPSLVGDEDFGGILDEGNAAVLLELEEREAAERTTAGEG